MSPSEFDFFVHFILGRVFPIWLALVLVVLAVKLYRRHRRPTAQASPTPAPKAGSFRIYRDSTRLELSRHDPSELIVVLMCLAILGMLIFQVPAEWRPGPGRNILWLLYGLGGGLVAWAAVGPVRRCVEGERYAFDRSTDRLVRNGRLIARLSQIERVLITEQGLQGYPDYRYGVSLGLQEGRRVELDQFSPSDAKQARDVGARDLSREVAGFLGVPVEREWLTKRPLLE